MDWSSFLGGSADEQAYAMVLDDAGTPWTTGSTLSDDWAAGGLDIWQSGGWDTFLVKTVDEPGWHVQFQVSLSEEPADAMAVSYATVDLTARADRDYRPVSGKLTFVPGEPLQQTVQVAILADEQHEPDELFGFDLTSLDFGITAPRGTATIVDEDPQISATAVRVDEGDTGSDNAVIAVTLSRASAETVQVRYATQDGTAQAGSDYDAATGTLTFSPGETVQEILIPVHADAVDELDESFLVVFSGAVEGVVAVESVAVTIDDDDDPTLAVQDLIVLEANGAGALFTVSLSSPPLETTTVDFATADGTATASSDYIATQGTLVFEPGGGTSQTISVPVTADAEDEIDEAFVINLSNPSGAKFGDSQATVTISDDQPLVTVTDVTVTEGDSGTVQAVFTVRLSAASPHAVVVDYATADGTAAAGSDYTGAAGTLTFSPGDTEQTVTVVVHGDAEDETNETFFVELTSAANAAIADGQGQGTIVGDDGPLLSIDDVEIVEGDNGTSYAEFRVSLSAAAGQDVQVSYVTAEGTATAGSDYSPVSGTLLFQTGQPLEQTFLVPVIGDTRHEGDEWFAVNLHSATVAAISDPQAVATITGDDPALSIGDASLTETHSGNPVMTFTVSISQDPLDTVTVDYSTQAGTASQGQDYLLASGTLIFSPGEPLQQTIAVNLIGDLVNEIHEQFTVDLSNPVNAELSDAQAVGTILDDDGPKLTIADASINEGDDGTVGLSFTVSLTAVTGAAVTVDFATEPGSAASGADFQAVTGSLTFDAGVTEQTITVPVVGDTVDEVDETFLVRLTNAVGVPVLKDVGQGTIRDDDQATLAIDDVNVPEGFDGWINSRTWQGTYWVTPMTGESYHEMRISGAAAVDDPWLVSGNDIGRFRFQVKTMGVKAMTLHAEGQEGAVRLTWAQDDFDLLAGYHLYRSATPDGVYQRLNDTIIPVGQESFIDTDVTPAVPMYYKFSVAQTDLAESDFSNTASAASLDTVAPQLVHTPKNSAPASSGLRLTATATDNVAVTGVVVHHRPLGSTVAYAALPMVNISGNTWSATITGSTVQPPGIEYYLVASDGLNQVYHGTAAAPHSVVVDAAPSLSSVTPNSGAVEGGTRVTVSGTLFQQGAVVEFGGQSATDVVVQTENQIICTTPAHFPAMVDVRVVNPDNTEATLLNGFRYVDEDAVVSLPTMSADHGAIVDIPLSLSNVDGLRAAGVTVSFDPAVLKVKGVSTGTLTSDWYLESNFATAGRVTVWLASATASSGNGTLAKIHVEVVGAATAQTALTIETAQLNAGAIEPDLSNGVFYVNGFFQLSGSVKYFKGNGPVPGVALGLVGVGVQSAATDATGVYSFDAVQTGAYTLTPEKVAQVAEITAYDASLVLQAAAGLRTLSANEILAADVNRDGMVEGMDAAYILEKSVGLLTGTFPGAGKYWDFTPAEKTYPQLNGDLVNQNFTAVLIGDVSGNWQTGGGQGEGEIEAGEARATLTIPYAYAQPGDIVQVPVQLAGTAEFQAVDLVLTYDASKLSLIDIRREAAAAGLSWIANTEQPGWIRVAMAGAQAAVRSGDLLTLRFRVEQELDSPSPVAVQSVRLNEIGRGIGLKQGAVFDTVAPPDWLDRLGPRPWQNPRDRFDVDAQGGPQPVDVLTLINHINANGIGSLPEPTPSLLASHYLDVSGDGQATPLDVLQVINRINELLADQVSGVDGELLDILAGDDQRYE